MIGSIDKVRLDFIKEHAKDVMHVSPIRYVKEAKLCGRLFHPEDATGVVSSVDTDFWIDHTEPLEVLARTRDRLDWPLGDLHDGHEFLLVAEVKQRYRLRSRSTLNPTPLS